MTNDEIRLQFGELNASEMRLARAIVGWHEREQAKLRAAADVLAEALDETLTKLAGWHSLYEKQLGSDDIAVVLTGEAALAAYKATKP
jgi:hypothetical protein